MKKIALILLLYFAIYLLIIIFNWIKLYMPMPSSGGNDGASGLGKGIASAVFGLCSFIALVGGIWSFALFKNHQHAGAIQFILLFIIAIVSIALLLFVFG